jgi:hypothetical protein
MLAGNPATTTNVPAAERTGTPSRDFASPRGDAFALDDEGASLDARDAECGGCHDDEKSRECDQ